MEYNKKTMTTQNDTTGEEDQTGTPVPAADPSKTIQNAVPSPKPLALGLKTYTAAPAMQLKDGVDYQAVMHTSKGDITLDLFEKEVPVTVNNFVFLAKDRFYDSVIFHRIISGFMIQGGDPKGDGTGGPGYKFNNEPVTKDYKRGIIAMANAGPNTNGSQFFIMHQSQDLPKLYTIFGEVTNGLDVVDKIAATPVKASDRGEMSVPQEKVMITGIDIIEK